MPRLRPVMRPWVAAVLIGFAGFAAVFFTSVYLGFFERLTVALAFIAFSVWTLRGWRQPRHAEFRASDARAYWRGVLGGFR